MGLCSLNPNLGMSARPNPFAKLRLPDLSESLHLVFQRGQYHNHSNTVLPHLEKCNILGF